MDYYIRCSCDCCCELFPDTTLGLLGLCYSNCMLLRMDDGCICSMGSEILSCLLSMEKNRFVYLHHDFTFLLLLFSKRAYKINLGTPSFISWFMPSFSIGHPAYRKRRIQKTTCYRQIFSALKKRIVFFLVTYLCGRSMSGINNCVLRQSQ